MQFRKIQDMGGANGKRSYGITLDKKQLEFDGVLEQLENGEDLHAVVSRQGEREWMVTIPEPPEEAVQEPPTPVAGHPEADD